MAFTKPITLLSVFLLCLSQIVLARQTAEIESYLSKTASESLTALLSFLRIPSVSADTARAPEVRRCAAWLIKYLAQCNLENIQILESPRHPAVYADWLHAPGKPTLLIYAHYDVQPEDPLDLWITPPFQPDVRDGRVYARGATDDKGHLMVPVRALNAFLKVNGSLPLNVKVLFEGEEEIASPNLRSMLSTHKSLLSADYVLVSDGGMAGPDIPAIQLGTRGILTLEITLTVANRDMHSGSFGGGVQNPIHAISALLASLRDITTGKVLVDGFYDDVDIITEEERKDLSEYPISSAYRLNEVGAKSSVGEEGFSFYERTWNRPTLELVGLKGGFQGTGIKTVLPSQASAKISARLVSSQVGKKIMKSLKEHLYREVEKIPGISIELFNEYSDCDAFRTRKDTPSNRVAVQVLTDLFGRKPVYSKMGGTIPALRYIQEELGVDATVFAFGTGHKENAHAPNECVELSSLRRGEVGYVRMIQALADFPLQDEEGKKEL